MKPFGTRSLLALGALSALAVLLPPSSTRAEEGGSGHYMPGATATFIDALPGEAGPVLLHLHYIYDGSAGFSLPIAGLVSTGLEATVYAPTFAFVYQTDVGILGGKYAAGVAVPLLTMKVRGQLAGPVGTIRRVDTETGLGDMLFYPLMHGWTAAGGDLKYDVRLGVYAPTGEYRARKLANLGKNYWTFEPSASVSYLSSKIGLEASLFTGFDINTKNEDTDYESGSAWHMDATLAQHLPLFGGFGGIGANGFAYLQITDDSGAGARLGGFRGHTVGVGPVVSYVREVGTSTVVGEFKWLPEIDTDKRLEGDHFWIKIAVDF